MSSTNTPTYCNDEVGFCYTHMGRRVCACGLTIIASDVWCGVCMIKAKKEGGEHGRVLLMIADNRAAYRARRGCSRPEGQVDATLCRISDSYWVSTWRLR